MTEHDESAIGTNSRLTESQLQILMQEYGHLKVEISVRLKTMFSHVGYAGAIVAFAIPASGQLGVLSIPPCIPVVIALLAAGLLGATAMANWRWIQHCNAYLCSIERRVNASCGRNLLGWERYAQDTVRTPFFMPPRPNAIPEERP